MRLFLILVLLLVLGATLYFSRSAQQEQQALVQPPPVQQADASTGQVKQSPQVGAVPPAADPGPDVTTAPAAPRTTQGQSEFKQGVNYLAIAPARPQAPPGDKVQVIEFFMYSCPHCFHFEPILDHWLANKPADVAFVRVPVLFGGYANMHAQVYYALQAIGEAKRLTPLIFNAIHVQRIDLRSLHNTEAFLAKNGVDMTRFKQALSSFAVVAKTNRALTLMRRYNITGVPSMVVDGRYKTKLGEHLTYQQVPALVNFLVGKVEAERKAVAD